MNAPAIRLVDGLHLTAANRRHMADMLARGMATGATRALSYQLAPVEGTAGQWRYTIRKQERDDWGRPVARISRGIIAAALSGESGPIPV